MRALVHKLQRVLGASTFATNLAVLVRNQARAVIRYHLGEDANYLLNGESWLAETIAPHCHTFVDIGANCGDWTAAVLRGAPSDCRGLLIDPARPAHQILLDRFKEHANLEILRAAASDRAGEAEFYEEPGAGETSSLVGSFCAKDAQRTTVPVTTLDDELQKRGWTHCDVLKIDAEGYDLHVLQGATRLLAGQHIGILQFEYNVPWAAAGSTLAAAFSLLEGYGYRVFLLRSTGLHPFDYPRYGEYFTYSNFVAVSPASMPHLAGHIRGSI